MKAVFEAVIISLLVGAFATSGAEYFFKYNLVDLIFEKISGLFKKGKADVVTEAQKIEKKL